MSAAQDVAPGEGFPESYEALKRDIQTRGVLVPIEFDEDGNVLDGHRRLRAAQEVGKDYPKVIRLGLSDKQKAEHGIKLNALRRPLGPISWVKWFRELAELRGISLGQGSRNDRTSANVAEVATELGMPYRTAARRLALAEELSDYPDIAELVDRGEMPAKRALRVKRERESRQRLAGATFDMPADAPDCRQGDFRSTLADVPNASVDAILTDPPYGDNARPLWDGLGTLAGRVLRPSGLLVTYSGQMLLPHVFETLLRPEHGLSYVWTIAVQGCGPKNLIYPIRFYSRWKPVLVFAKGKPDRKEADWLDDFWEGTGQEKDLHPWQQAEDESEHFVRAFSAPGSLVVDPFLGSGTTAVAAYKSGRRFIGCDIDPYRVAQAQERLAKVVQGREGLGGAEACHSDPGL